MSTTAPQLAIVECGPKHALLPQLDDIGRVPTQHRPLFSVTIQHPHHKSFTATVGVLVNGIKAEDGSGNNWIIEGYISPAELRKHSWLKQLFGSTYGGTFHGFVDVRNRRGFVHPGTQS